MLLLLLLLLQADKALGRLLEVEGAGKEEFTIVIMRSN